MARAIDVVAERWPERERSRLLLRVIDASAAIGAFYPADPHHGRVVALLERHASGGFAVHPMTLAECLVGATRVGHLAQVSVQIRNMGIEATSPDPDEPQLIAEIRSNTRLKLPDRCVLSAALSLSAPLMTFDEKLRDSARAQSVDLVE